MDIKKFHKFVGETLAIFQLYANIFSYQCFLLYGIITFLSFAPSYHCVQSVPKDAVSPPLNALCVYTFNAETIFGEKLTPWVYFHESYNYKHLKQLAWMKLFKITATRQISNYITLQHHMPMGIVHNHLWK